MVEINNKIQECNICKNEYTSTYAEAMPGVKIYVCEKCLESAKHNFIWICMSCGEVYIRPKSLILQRLDNFELKKAYLTCQDMQIIQGIDMCIKCDPEGILNYMDKVKVAAEC